MKTIIFLLAVLAGSLNAQMTLTEKLLGNRIDRSDNRLEEYKENYNRVEGTNVAQKGTQISFTDEITEGERFPSVNGITVRKIRIIEVQPEWRKIWIADPTTGKLVYYYPGFDICRGGVERYEFRDTVVKKAKPTRSWISWKCGGRAFSLYTTAISRSSVKARKMQSQFDALAAKYYLPANDARFQKATVPEEVKNKYRWYWTWSILDSITLAIAILVCILGIVRVKKTADVISAVPLGWGVWIELTLWVKTEYTCWPNPFGGSCVILRNEVSAQHEWLMLLYLLQAVTIGLVPIGALLLGRRIARESHISGPNPGQECLHE